MIYLSVIPKKDVLCIPVIFFPYSGELHAFVQLHHDIHVSQTHFGHLELNNKTALAIPILGKVLYIQNHDICITSAYTIILCNVLNAFQRLIW